MLPFQNESFTPDDPAILHRVRSGERVTGLYLGATAYVVDDARWIVVDSGGFTEARGPWLAYPLPESYGMEHISAIKCFKSVWRMAAERIRPAIDRIVPKSATVPTPPPTPKPQPRKRAIGRPVALVGAVPLPGMESWIRPGVMEYTRTLGLPVGPAENQPVDGKSQPKHCQPITPELAREREGLAPVEPWQP